MTQTVTDTNQCVVFTLEERLYGIRLSVVSRVIHAVEVTPLPKAPSIVAGVIDLGGRIVPVVNLRRRFNLPEREPRLTDRLIVAEVSRIQGDGGRLLALAVDDVLGVQDLPPDGAARAETILPGLQYLEGAAKTDQGLLMIHDLRTLLSLEEERALQAILPKAGE
jgi:purine-binding chemotaxis protein CheW